MINPVLRGWMAYYGRFYRSALYPLFDRINYRLMRWIRKKYRIGVRQACRVFARRCLVLDVCFCEVEQAGDEAGISGVFAQAGGDVSPSGMA
jgi:Group II intron, maturase-specific domain